MALTTQQIIDIAKVSKYLANKRASQGSLYGPPVDPMLGLKLYVVRKDLEWMYNIDPTNVDIIPVQNYLYMMCSAEAQAVIIGGGGTVTPGTVTLIKSPIRITGAEFASALSWTGTNSDSINILSSYTLQVFWNTYNRFLDEGISWSRTATGFDIIIDGTVVTAFDATGANIDDVFYIYISA